MPKKEIAIRHATILAAYLLIVWGFYRFLFKLPEEVEELFVKPLLWLVPIFYFVRKEKLGLSSVGVSGKNLFSSIYLALGLGILFAIEGALINFLKYGGINFAANIGQRPLIAALGLSFATAVSEEITFRGYLFNRVWHALGKEYLANAITSVIYGLIHIPVAVFWWELSLTGILGYLLLITIFGIGSAFVFARTRNIISSVLLHVMWAWPIILFR